MAKKQTNKIKFHKKLILFKFILNLFKVDSIDKLGQNLKDTYLEEIDIEKQQTKFFQVISNRFVFDEEYLTVAQLERYDENIIANNWMALEIIEWTITPDSGDEISAYLVTDIGCIYTDNLDGWVDAIAYNLRPVFYLNSSASFAGGTGTESDPYRIA